MVLGNIRMDGPVEGCRARLILAHGAGAGMDSEFMAEMAMMLADRHIRVARFDFLYMQLARESGRRRPPDTLVRLLEQWRAVRDLLQAAEPGNWALGGKSMGGRMASLLAAQEGAPALVCLGYPFHPVGKPERLRVEHLQTIEVPTLIIQGERDTFGWRQEVAGYELSAAVQLHWLHAADHDFRPLKSSGGSWHQHMQAAADRVADFLADRQG